MRRIESCTPG